jgi:hypothetical protein
MSKRERGRERDVMIGDETSTCFCPPRDSGDEGTPGGVRDQGTRGGRGKHTHTNTHTHTHTHTHTRRKG